LCSQVIQVEHLDGDGLLRLVEYGVSMDRKQIIVGNVELNREESKCFDDKFGVDELKFLEL
jgi:hypothetical protein